MAATTSTTPGDTTSWRRWSPWVGWSVVGGLGLLVMVTTWHFSINVPVFDDWILVHTAARWSHDPFSSAIWAQYLGQRLVVPRLIAVVLANIGLFNFQVMALLGALVDVGACVAVLFAVHWSSNRRFSAGWMTLFALSWFSLVDIVDLLWVSATPWMFTLGGLGLMCAAFASPRLGPWWALSLGGLAALLASLSWVHGFLLWPIGIAAWLWSRPPSRARRLQVLAFSSVGVVFVLAYLRHFHLSQVTYFCPPGRDCSAIASLRSPQALIPFFLRILGQVVPEWSWFGPFASQCAGAVLLGLSVWVLASTVTARRFGRTVPVPAMLVLFGLGTAALVAIGRLHFSSGVASYYSMASAVTWSGVILHETGRWRARSTGDAPWVATLGRVVFAAVVVVLSLGSLGPGLTEATHWRAQQVAAGRFVVNRDHLTAAQIACGENLYIGGSIYTYANALDHYQAAFLQAQQHGWAMFSEPLMSELRAQGPPDLHACS